MTRKARVAARKLFGPKPFKTIWTLLVDCKWFYVAIFVVLPAVILLASAIPYRIAITSVPTFEFVITCQLAVASIVATVIALAVPIRHEQLMKIGLNAGRIFVGKGWFLLLSVDLASATGLAISHVVRKTSQPEHVTVIVLSLILTGLVVLWTVVALLQFVKTLTAASSTKILLENASDRFRRHVGDRIENLEDRFYYSNERNPLTHFVQLIDGAVMTKDSVRSQVNISVLESFLKVHLETLGAYKRETWTDDDWDYQQMVVRVVESSLVADRFSSTSFSTVLTKAVEREPQIAWQIVKLSRRVSIKSVEQGASEVFRSYASLIVDLYYICRYKNKELSRKAGEDVDSFLNLLSYSIKPEGVIGFRGTVVGDEQDVQSLHDVFFRVALDAIRNAIEIGQFDIARKLLRKVWAEQPRRFVASRSRARAQTAGSLSSDVKWLHSATEVSAIVAGWTYRLMGNRMASLGEDPLPYLEFIRSVVSRLRESTANALEGIAIVEKEESGDPERWNLTVWKDPDLKGERRERSLRAVDFEWIREGAIVLSAMARDRQRREYIPGAKPVLREREIEELRRTAERLVDDRTLFQLGDANKVDEDGTKWKKRVGAVVAQLEELANEQSASDMKYLVEGEISSVKKEAFLAGLVDSYEQATGYIKDLLTRTSATAVVGGSVVKKTLPIVVKELLPRGVFLDNWFIGYMGQENMAVALAEMEEDFLLRYAETSARPYACPLVENGIVECVISAMDDMRTGRPEKVEELRFLVIVPNDRRYWRVMRDAGGREDGAEAGSGNWVQHGTLVDAAVVSRRLGKQDGILVISLMDYVCLKGDKPLVAEVTDTTEDERSDYDIEENEYRNVVVGVEIKSTSIVACRKAYIARSISWVPSLIGYSVDLESSTVHDSGCDRVTENPEYRSVALEDCYQFLWDQEKEPKVCQICIGTDPMTAML